MHACLRSLLSNGPRLQVNSGDAGSTTVAKQGTNKHTTNSQYNHGSVFFGVRPRGYITRVFSKPGQFSIRQRSGSQWVSNGKGCHKSWLQQLEPGSSDQEKRLSCSELWSVYTVILCNCVWSNKSSCQSNTHLIIVDTYARQYWCSWLHLWSACHFVWPPAVYAMWTVACLKISVRTEKHRTMWNVSIKLVYMVVYSLIYFSIVNKHRLFSLQLFLYDLYW
jgi:hypothetical protein